MLNDINDGRRTWVLLSAEWFVFKASLVPRDCVCPSSCC